MGEEMGEEEVGEEEAGQEEGREEGCEEAQEEEGEEGALRRRQAREGPAQEQGCDRGRKKNALKQKAAGKGIFKVRTCSAALAAITGKAKMTTGQIVKAVWVYIKAKKLHNKRTITPDAALGKVIGGKTTMFKMNKALFKHVK